MPRPLAHSLTALALTFGFLAGVAAEPDVPREAVRVKGTSVRLTPPEGFVTAERYPGFQNEELRASIQVTVLPGPVAEVFEERLRAALPLRADKILARVREARGGKLNDPRFGSRMSGEGPYAQAAMALFEATAKRLGLETGHTKGESSDAKTFQRPEKNDGRQLKLF